MAEPLDTMIEVREELMVSPNADSDTRPSLRKAHFLKPSLKSVDCEVPKLPLDSVSTFPPTFDPINWPLIVNFHGWSRHIKKWDLWVDRMMAFHQLTWRKAGIFEAILSSKYVIERNHALVIGISERWCPETNTFIFPWGEVTITLEDMFVLGGYSVLGDPVFSSLGIVELKDVEDRLMEARREIRRGKAAKASQGAWMKRFMESDCGLEHEAFLALWLSRFVFPNTHGTIRECVLPLAIRLARGIPIALAPAVLATLYRDLSLLKVKIVALCQLDICVDEGADDVLNLILWSPFQLVQIWVWERFLELRPCPKLISFDEPRVARWHKTKIVNAENVRLALDLASLSFQWRLCSTGINDVYFPKFYGLVDKWVNVNPNLDREMESFARCLRVAELVGFDCIEQYLPNRVARQFGIDQDLPSSVARLNATSRIGWNSYNKHMFNLKLYIPSRDFKAEVTVRYFDWWRKSIVVSNTANRRVVQCQRSLIICKEEKGDNEASIPPGFPPKCCMVEVSDFVREEKSRIADLSESSYTFDTGLNSACAYDKHPENEAAYEASQNSNASIHPDSPSKCSGDQTVNEAENELTNGENLRCGKHANSKLKGVCDVSHSPCQTEKLYSSIGDKKNVTDLNRPRKPVEKVTLGEVEMAGSQHVVSDAENPVNSTSEKGTEGNGWTCPNDERLMQLDARISRLERLVAQKKVRT